MRLEQQALKEGMLRGKDGIELWVDSKDQITLDKALDSLFANTPYRELAEEAFYWLQQHIPYRCGVRLGKDRISFLIGNYRPAALKRDNNRLRLDMGFVGRLPEAFDQASLVWRTVDAKEGYVIIDKMPLPLSASDLCRFIAACKEFRRVAPKSRRWPCNVVVSWPKDKPFP